MRKVLLAVLAVALTVGCSRQPAPHVGEWDAEFFSEGKKLFRLPAPYMPSMVFYFSENNNVQYLAIFPSEGRKDIWEGEYRFDYSKKPTELNIDWRSGATVSHHGIVRFIGDDHKQMQFCFSLKNEPRPSNFDNASTCYFLTKKMNK